MRIRRSNHLATRSTVSQVNSKILGVSIIHELSVDHPYFSWFYNCHRDSFLNDLTQVWVYHDTHYMFSILLQSQKHGSMIKYISFYLFQCCYTLYPRIFCMPHLLPLDKAESKTTTIHMLLELAQPEMKSAKAGQTTLVGTRQKHSIRSWYIHRDVNHYFDY